MQLHRETIATNLSQTRRLIKPTWVLRHTWFLNKFEVRWKRSNPSARLVLWPFLGPEIILAEAHEGDQTFDFNGEIFDPVLLGDKSEIGLICPKGSAACFIRIDVDIQTTENNSEES